MRLLRDDRALLFTLTLAYFALMFTAGKDVVVSFRVPHDATAAAYVAQHSWAIRLGSFLELVSALPLAVFMAISVGRLRLLETRTAGEPVAALGAIATPLMLAGSALATWSLTRPGVAALPGSVAVLQSLGFDGGGPGFAVFLGFFVAGVSLAAGLQKQIPRWLMWMGLVVAAAGELSCFTLLNFTAGYFIPVARFLSIAWMLCFAIKLPGGLPEPQATPEMNRPDLLQPGQAATAPRFPS